VRNAPRLSIIWHSRTGAIEALVVAMTNAAAEFSVEVRAIKAADACASDICSSDGIIFACPENLGALSGLMKEFFDVQYYALLHQVNGKAYACVVAAGSDGSGAVRQIERIATGLRLKKVHEAVIVITHAQSALAIAAPKSLDTIQLAPAIALAQTLAAGLEAGVF
jgi:multimeric flavodoxin WrbA